MEIIEITPPEILHQTSACPSKLYAIGNVDLLNEKHAVAIVGSRRATDYGLRNAYKISKSLAQAGVVVVSGLALGIDASAHRGALDAKGKTIAVLGSAIDRFEPRTNEQLAKKIITCGGLILSEYPKGSATYPTNFVLRNRIIAGLTQATVVIEAQEKSGALITANLAAEYNRLVYALPGDVERLNSMGTNRLISLGATCLCDASIILEDLGMEKEKQIQLPLNDREKEIAVLLNTKPISFDKIVGELQIKPAELLAILFALELKGVVRKNEEGLYLISSL